VGDSRKPHSVDLGGEGPEQSDADKALRLVIDQFLVEWIDGEMVYAETDNLIQKISDAGFEFVWWGPNSERVEVERRLPDRPYGPSGNPDVSRSLRRAIGALIGEPATASDVDVILGRLERDGFVVVRADGLEHGDTLVKVMLDRRVSFDSGVRYERQAAFVVEREP
jgi:hypothetical protein